MKFLLLALGFFSGTYKSSSQQNATTVLNTMSGFVDQYNKSFDKTSVKDKLIVFYVAGLDDPLTLVFDKLKDKKIVDGENVQLMAGFGKMSGHMSASDGMKHMQSGFKTKYGDSFFSILLDIKGDLETQLKTTGMAIITISKKDNTMTYTDYGTDRKKFLDALNEYFK